MPSQDGAGGDDEPHRGEAPDRQRPGQQRQPRTVRPRQPRMSPRPLAQGDRELIAQHKDLGVLPPRLPPRQPEQRHRTGDKQKDQLQAHKPKIIAPPARPTPAARRQTRDQADGELRCICPGGTGFRHAQGDIAGFRHRRGGRDCRPGLPEQVDVPAEGLRAAGPAALLKLGVDLGSVGEALVLRAWAFGGTVPPGRPGSGLARVPAPLPAPPQPQDEPRGARPPR